MDEKVAQLQIETMTKNLAQISQSLQDLRTFQAKSEEAKDFDRDYRERVERRLESLQNQVDDTKKLLEADKGRLYERLRKNEHAIEILRTHDRSLERTAGRIWKFITGAAIAAVSALFVALTK